MVTTSRADYGILRGLMRAIADDPELELLVVATGMRLASEFGLTSREIEADGFTIDRAVDMLVTAAGETDLARSVSAGLAGFAGAFAELRPDIVVLLGDRFELLAPALAAFFARIPIAHIHGGETSQGALDEGVRHAVTKLASLHFTATEAYRDRVVQLGEDPARVLVVGAPGLDILRDFTPLSRAELEARLSFPLSPPLAMVTYHPVTLEPGRAAAQIDALLAALRQQGVRAVITKANADEEGRLINERLAAFCAERPEDYRLFDNLGQDGLSQLSRGHRPSGRELLERLRRSGRRSRSPWCTSTNRQVGRIRAATVDRRWCGHGRIAPASEGPVDRVERGLVGMANAPGAKEDAGGAVSGRVKDALKGATLGEQLLKKQFHDLPGAAACRRRREARAMNDKITRFLASADTTVLEAMSQLEDTAQKIVFVVDDDRTLIGALTDGDIRRSILAGGGLEDAVGDVCNREPFTVSAATTSPPSERSCWTAHSAACRCSTGAVVSSTCCSGRASSGTAPSTSRRCPSTCPWSSWPAARARGSTPSPRCCPSR